PRALPAVLGLLALASLALVFWTQGTRPAASFYFLPWRAWELLAGVLAAVAVRRGLPALRHAGLLTAAGLAAILAALAFTPPSAAWPGAWVLLPVAGTILVLLYGDTPSPAARLLSLPPLVFTGLVSYSLYLWHQPVLSLAAAALRPATPDAGLRSVLAALCLGLAWASWRWIEQPFRQGRVTPRRMRALWIGTTVALTLFAVGGHVTEGYPARLPAEARRAIAYEDSL